MYPAIKEASLVSDCLPEPPTPTRRALPHGVRIIRDILGKKMRKMNLRPLLERDKRMLIIKYNQ